MKRILVLERGVVTNVILCVDGWLPEIPGALLVETTDDPGSPGIGWYLDKSGKKLCPPGVGSGSGAGAGA